MKRVSVRELHLNTSALVKDVVAGEIVLIEKRGVPPAELRPIMPAFSGKTLPNREKLLRRFPKVKCDSGRCLEGDRF